MHTTPGTRVGRGQSASSFLKQLARMFPGRAPTPPILGTSVVRVLAGGGSSAWLVPEIGTGLSISGATGVLPARFTAVDLRWKRHEFNDFASVAAAAPNVSGAPYASTSGAGTVALTASDTSRPGIVRLSSGNIAGYGAVVVDAATPSILINNGPIELQVGFTIPTLSNGTNRFSLVMGLTDSVNNLTNSIYALYSDNVNSGAMRLDGRIAGVITSANGSTALVGGTNYVATIVIHSSTDVRLYLRAYGQNNDTLQATLTSGVPTSVGMFISIGVFRVLANGGGVDVDFYQFDHQFGGSSR